MSEIEDPWHSRPLDVHRWSDHPEAKRVVEKVWGKYFSDPKAVRRGPKQKTEPRRAFRRLICLSYAAISDLSRAA